MKALVTRKIGMTSTINQNGVVEAITLLSVGDNVVTQIKNSERDGYTAIQVGFESKKDINKAQVGHAKAAGVTPRYFREFRISDDVEMPEVGTKMTADTSCQKGASTKAPPIGSVNTDLTNVGTDV